MFEFRIKQFLQDVIFDKSIPLQDEPSKYLP